MLEVFKTVNSLNPSYLWDFFITKQIEYNLRIKTLVKLPQITTHAFGRHSVTFRGSILWNTLSDDIKMWQLSKKNKDMEGGKLQLQIMLLIGPCILLYIM